MMSSEAVSAQGEAPAKEHERDRYSRQVGLRDVRFTFDEVAAAALGLDRRMAPVERAELYLRQRILVPIELVEYDGTLHRVLAWDPGPVGHSGFMGCVTHSIAATDHGTFEVGRYPGVSLETSSKVWQWFIHRRLEEG